MVKTPIKLAIDRKLLTEELLKRLSNFTFNLLRANRFNKGLQLKTEDESLDIVHEAIGKVLTGKRKLPKNKRISLENKLQIVIVSVTKNHYKKYRNEKRMAQNIQGEKLNSMRTVEPSIVNNELFQEQVIEEFRKRIQKRGLQYEMEVFELSLEQWTNREIAKELLILDTRVLRIKEKLRELMRELLSLPKPKQENESKKEKKKK